MNTLIRVSWLAISRLTICAYLLAGCGNDTTGLQGKEATGHTPASGISAVNSRTEYAGVKGKSIAYRTIGNGQPMILCQRFRGNLDDWDPAFLDQLAKHYTVITFDYSGLGLSGGDPHTDMKGFTSDVVNLAAALGYEKIILGGWSFGGWVAQVVMTSYPDLVSHTILIGTKPPGANNHSFEKIFLETAYKPVNDFEDEVILFFEPISQFSRKAAKESHDRIAARTIDRDSLVRPDQFVFYGKGNEDFTKDPYNARQKMTETKIPVLVISGDHEVCFPPENWFELNRKLPTTHVVVFPRTGHGPHHQYPEMTARYINAFIENNLSTVSNR